MRKSGIQLLTMITGIFIALVVVFSQFFFFQDAGNTKKLVKTENQEKQKNNTEKKNCISPPSFSQSGSAHADINPKSPSYLFDILFGHLEDEDRTTEVPISFGKFFQTLFRVFITPNAP